MTTDPDDSVAPRSARERPLELFVVSLGGSWDPGLPIAASRAGGVGLLDLTYLADASHARRQVARLAELSHRGRHGLVLHGRAGDVESAALDAIGACDTILLTPEAEHHLPGLVARARRVATRVGLVCTRESHARLAEAAGLDLVVAKGHEAGGRIGSETSFVLLQRLLRASALPVAVWGGVGLHTAPGCRAAGAAGVILDWQLALTRESPLADRMRRRVESMDGSETAVVQGPPGQLLRAYTRPGMAACERLSSAAGSPENDREEESARWEATVRSLLTAERPEERLWLVGQDAAFAHAWPKGASSVSRALSVLRASVEHAVHAAAAAPALSRESALARSHGTEYPAVQGPMTRVSDVPEFIEAVARAGGLPFVALALMRGDEVRPLLQRTRDLLRDRPWGVGILGFVGESIRAEQLEVLSEVRPPYAIIAGGRPDQAASLEANGVRTYLHVPSPEMLRMFLRDGARRFIFEGSECGGHVGPRTSFVLWDTMIRVLLEAGLSDEESRRVHVLFAGGIHDALSAAVVSTTAQALVERGMKVGVLMGSAYLFTEEIVATQAVTETFQHVVLGAGETVLLETGPGHAIRCAPTAYADDFTSKKRELKERRLAHGDVRDELERMNVGRLRIASKGLTRADSTGAERRLTAMSADDQRRLGMYMMGQVVGLRDERLTIRALHEEVCAGSARVLRSSCHGPAVPASPEEPGAVPPPFDVAIIGMGCLFPGAHDVGAFWNTILERRDAIREVPADRFDASRWFDSDRKARDRIYSKWGGFLEDVRFDPLRYRIPPAALKSIEPLQLLALEVVDRALRDAGYAGDNPYRRRTSVILGAGGGLSELGSNYTFRAAIPQFIENPDDTLWDQLPEWTEDSFPGILLNLVAGRIANRFDFGGINYVVDAACASSLAAVYQACGELANGTSDLVITGGCDTVQNPLGYVCFSKTGALSPCGRSRPFDASADGIAISEGLAVVVLKRRVDAERDGDRIYALIRGVAGGSDGRTRGVTAPHGPGQARVIERAYRQAGFSPATVGLLEAHGTGTELGDRTEFEALTSVLSRHSTRPRSIALGSVKSMIGHTKCAAGVAGLIKTTLSLYHRVLPPTIHVEEPIEPATREDAVLYLNTEVRPWIRGAHPRRAGVSAFGFGGSNFHAVLEEYDGEARTRAADTPHRPRPAELIVAAGESAGDLAARLREIRDAAARLNASGETRFGDLALALHRRGLPGNRTHRAAFVAPDAPALAGQIDALLSRLEGDGAANTKLPAGVHYSSSTAWPADQIAFLFPGQGSQFPDMLRDLAVEFAEVRQRFELADAVLQEAFDRPLSHFVFPPPAFTDRERAAAIEALKSTDVAQSALGVSGTAMMRLLESFGVRPSMVAGHSFGELVALHAAGSIAERDLYALSWSRGKAMLATREERPGGDLGRMMAVNADEARVREVVADCPSVWLANLNSPRQTVLSGSAEGLAAARRKLEAAGLSAAEIPVACAFHSPYMDPARNLFADVLAEVDVRAPRLAVYSNLTAERYAEDLDALRHALADQIVSRVRFAEEIEAMYAAGARVFVEVGPGNVLSKLVSQNLESRPHVTVATQPAHLQGVTALLHALAALFAQGVEVDLERLYEGRGAAAPGPDSPPAEGRREEDNVWLVNGAYARRAAEPPRTPAPRAVLRGTGEESRAARTGAARVAGREPEPAAPSAAAPSAAAARPAGERPDHPSEATRAAVTQENDSSPNVNLNVGLNVDAEVFEQFQKTMRQFLATQQAVMEAFLGAAASDGAPPLPSSAEAALEITPLPPARAIADERDAAALEAVVPALAAAEWIESEPAEPEPSEAERSTTMARGGEESRAPVSPGGAEEEHAASLDGRLRAIVSERTGYPPEMLDLDTNLEADLGIDSIKRVEIIGTFRRSVLPDLLEPPAWFMERMGAATTLRECLDGVRELLERQGASEMSGTTGATTSGGTAEPSGSMPPAATSAADLEERLANIIAERTGYPTDMLDPDADLEADLGIDSIKRVEIIGAFRRSVFPSMVEPPVWFMERMTSAATLRAICDGVAALLAREMDRSIEKPIPVVPVEAAPPARAAASAPASAGAVERAAGGVTSGGVTSGGGTSGGNGHDPALETCPRCVARVVPCLLPESDSVAVPAGVVLVTDDGEGAAEELARTIESNGGRAVVLDVSELGGRAETEALVATIRGGHGPIGALAHLGPSRSAPEFPGISAAAWASHLNRDLKSLLFLLQAVAPELGAAGGEPIAVLAVTRGAGDFGAAGEAVHPWRGGVAGLLKTAAREWTHARIRAIDVDEVPAPALLLRELSTPGPVEIGYRGGERWTVVAAEEEASTPVGATLLDERDVVLVTGGARGITAQIACEIALRARPTMILLGRSPRAAHPEDEATAGIDDPIALRQAIIAAKRRQGEAISPREVEARLGALLRNREIEQTLAAIETAGARVEYHLCDVRDRAALSGVVADIRRRFGGIDAVVHGAGVIEDRYLLDKDEPSFDRVVGTKLDPLLTLTGVLDHRRLKVVMLFSSVAGFYGNPGQGDYAAANEVLNRMARRLQDTLPARVVAMNWGPWDGAGMVTREVARQFEERGVGMVTTRAGREAAWRELLPDAGDEVVVIVGPGPWVRRVERSGAARSAGRTEDDLRRTGRAPSAT